MDWKFVTDLERFARSTFAVLLALPSFGLFQRFLRLL
jgi:hypothetical protein